EEALQHPRALGVGQVGAGDEHGVAAGRPCGHGLRAWELLGGAVLDQADHAALVAVDLAPRPELVLGLADPLLALPRIPPRPRLPPHAAAARVRRLADRRTREVVDRRHRPAGSGAAMSSTTTESVPTSRS